MGDQPIGVGVVGTGFGARVAVPGFASTGSASVTAVCGRNLERAEKTAAEYGVPFATVDVAQLCARDDVDVVFVATPPHLHRDVVLSALDAGKHVVCEKPFGLGPAEALEMLERAEQRQRLHFLDFEFRTDPARRELEALIRRGDLGEVRQVAITAMVAGVNFPVMNREGWWQRRELGGGWLGAMGSHYLDALRVWFGEVSSVSAHLETRRTHLTDDPARLRSPPTTGSWRGSSPTRASCASSTAQVPSVQSSVRASRSTAPPARPCSSDDHVLTVLDDSGHADRRDFGPHASDPRTHPSRDAMGAWANEIVEAVRTGTQIAPNFVDGLRVQEIMDAARRSSDQHGVEVTVERHPLDAAIRRTVRGISDEQ